MTALRHATPARLRQRHFPDFYRVNHQPVLRAIAATVGDHELAREAVDEAMTRAFQRWSTVSSYSNAPGWVYRVALNWALSRLRKQKREDLHDAPPEQPVHQALPDPDVEAALRALPVEPRRAAATFGGEPSPSSRRPRRSQES